MARLDVRLAFCDAVTEADLNLCLGSVRQYSSNLVPSPGSLNDPNTQVGDACYHRSRDAFGFVRGNAVVDINYARWERVNGRVGRVDTPAAGFTGLFSRYSNKYSSTSE